VEARFVTIIAKSYRSNLREQELHRYLMVVEGRKIINAVSVHLFSLIMPWFQIPEYNILALKF
jgi:hypothetical protein